MSADEQRKLAAIMFTDMVGYSALSQRDEKLAHELLEEHRRLLREIYRHFCEGLVARMTKDEAKARTAFTAARAEQEQRVQAQPDYGPALCVLGLIDAGLGRKEEALREGRRAMELMSVEKDSVNGAHMIEYFAITAAWAEEKDLACEQLAKALPLSGFYVSYGRLKLLPYWDPLRGDPRFEKIVASLAPK
jgi:serine/threonine-protein kinase